MNLIFKLYDQGYGYGHIRSELNLLGCVTKKGKVFGKNSLHEILRNEKYIGTYLYNRSVSKDANGKRNCHKNKQEKEIIKIEDAFPAIIDKNLFWRVQEKMDANKRLSARNKAKVNYLLAGLIYCRECGAALVGNSGSYKTQEGLIRYSYYECNKRNRQSICNNPRTRKEIVENLVLDRLHQEIFKPDRVANIVQKLNEYNKTKSGEINVELKYYKTELEQTKKQLTNIAMAIANGAPFETLTETLKDLENKKAKLEVKIQEAENISAREHITEDMIKKYLDQHCAAVESKNISECKKFIHHYVEKVIVDKDSVEVRFYVDFGYDGGGGGS